MSDGANDSVGWNEEAVVVQSRVVEAVANIAEKDLDDLETAFSSSSSSLSSEEDVDQVGVEQWIWGLGMGWTDEIIAARLSAVQLDQKNANVGFALPCRI